MASSDSLAMASMSDLGGRPWFSGALTIIMKRIVRTPWGCGVDGRAAARRVERAKQLLQTGRDFSQAEVAAHAGCSD
jgi:hypothetical protein